VTAPDSCRAVVFTGPGQVEIRDERLPEPGAGDVVVQTLRSAISAGTEMLIYRGLAPASLPADASLPSLSGTLAFPLKYGYASVGRVIWIGEGVDRALADAPIFAFQTHQTYFVADAAHVVRLPDEMPIDRAVFLPTAETAVNLVHDGRPLAGEKVVVFGQGIVGLLTTALLASTPLAALVSLDRIARRREASLALGATLALDPGRPEWAARLTQSMADPAPPGSDLTYELTGDPAVLDHALHATGFDGRVVIGSWYGEKRAALDLGGEFHRSRIRIISSQVSTVAPSLRGRWTHARRLGFALSCLDRIRPEGLITHRIPFEDAADAYRLLAEKPEQALQCVLTYPSP
jgi:2-desacetyl-2-hydroxyethyl bacteriochlorophyllide A dehydrogenase